MNLSIPADTWGWLVAIALLFLCCFGTVLYFRKTDKLVANRRIVEYFPTFVSTLGVLGTFYGITVGLLDFNTSDLDSSIPALLDGLKTAFFTSLAGMIGSVVLSGLINRLQDQKDGGVSDINQAAGAICQAVQQMSDLNKRVIEKLVAQIGESEKDRKAFYRSTGDVLEGVKSSQIAITETLVGINASQVSMASAMDSLVILARSQEGVTTAMKEVVDAMRISLGNLEKTTQEQSQVLASVQMSAQTLVVQQEANRDRIHTLLERKFEEFTELLKKSNTEALVEVMKNVTEEFQKQMNTLINKLIQDNFDQLNKSVERLNQWQQENKDMIVSLTHQYREMTVNFEATSTSLTRVKEDTILLVGEGGKLRQLIDALNKVIVEDERFLRVSKQLQETADLSKTNMEMFHESTVSLNDWVRKQRHFVDGVQLLIEKLNELDKIRDYGEQFWANTREKMEEGVNIISQGSRTLNTQLTDLDRQFYNRLSATLAELDNCITKMVDNVTQRR